MKDVAQVWLGDHHEKEGKKARLDEISTELAGLHQIKDSMEKRKSADPGLWRADDDSQLTRVTAAIRKKENEQFEHIMGQGEVQ